MHFEMATTRGHYKKWSKIWSCSTSKRAYNSDTLGHQTRVQFLLEGDLVPKLEPRMLDICTS